MTLNDNDTMNISDNDRRAVSQNYMLLLSGMSVAENRVLRTC